MGICWSLNSSLKPDHGLSSGSPKSAYSGAGTESCGDSVPSYFTWGETKSVEATNLKCFTYSELKSATRNFRSDGFLGEGVAGCVYKGWIHEKTLSYTIPGKGMLVSVKKLNHQSAQSQEEWLSDVKYLGQLSHPDLVKMIGYCAEDDYRLLVYGFMTNGSLENQLFRRRFNAEPLSWAMRLKIAIAAANGLAYLHRNEIIHKNFKSSNILLDTEFNAKLVDFGVSVDLAMETAGKYGYAAPEYVAVGHLSIKNDVYSFGVVLLELLTGRRATDNQRIPGGKSLVQWAKLYLKNKKKLHKIMDPALEGQISVEAGRAVAKLVLQCLQKDPRSRPVMNKVITRLQRLQNE